MKKLTVRVTQYDIDHASGPNHCPIDLACERQFGWEHGTGMSTIFETSEQRLWHLPKEATDFIVLFDRNREDAKPLSFEIESDE